MPVFGDFDWKRILVFPILIGVLSGIAGIFLHASIDFLTNFSSYLSSSDGWSVPYYILPPIGALIAGIIVYKIAPEAAGAGENAAIEAFHTKTGHIRARVAVIKLVATSFIVGSGGSAGREGPLGQISSSIASWFSTKLNLGEKDRRTLIVCGIAAGVGSIFKAPLGGALFATEVLYKRDHEVGVLIYSFISSLTAFMVFGSVYGLDAIFETQMVSLGHPIFIASYVVLGVFASIVGLAFIKSLNIVNHHFDRFSIPNYLKPALGGLFMGIVAYFSPQSIGVGYEWIQDMIFSELTLTVILILLVGKILATSFTIGSGGSGGLFGPSLVIGAAVGALFAEVFSLFFPQFGLYEAFVLGGMAAFITAVAKTPISAIILMVEIANSYQLLPGLMVAVIVAYILTGKESIYPAQVESRLQSPALRGELTINVLEDIPVRNAMTGEDIIFFKSDQKVSEVLSVIERTGHIGFPVIDKGRLVGVITFEDVEKVEVEERDKVPVSEVMTEKIISAYPDDNLESCLQKLVANDIGRILVVERDDPTKLAGLVTKKDIIKAHARAYHPGTE
ncbi:MAG: chloride channel protein [Archaeoglobaceae archaeon]